MQIADLLSPSDLTQCTPASKMRELCDGEKRKKNEDGNGQKIEKSERMERAELLRDFENGLPGFYY